MGNRIGFGTTWKVVGVCKGMGIETSPIRQKATQGNLMAHPIDVKTFHSASKQAQEAVRRFFEHTPGLSLEHVSVIQVVPKGLKITEFLLDDSGSRYIVKGRNDVASQTRFVECVLTYEASAALHDMAQKAAQA